MTAVAAAGRLATREWRSSAYGPEPLPGPEEPQHATSLSFVSPSRHRRPLLDAWRAKQLMTSTTIGTKGAVLLSLLMWGWL